MMRSPPKEIFRYRGFTNDDLQDKNRAARLLSELNAAARGETWFSTIEKQNDPFDTSLNYRDSRPKEVKEFFEAFWKIAGKNASLSNDNFVAFAKNQGNAGFGCEKTP